MATNTWFVMIPPSYVSASAAEKELVDFRVQYPAGSQAWNDANAGKILSASESGEGQQLVKWQGPFATEAEAKTAQNPQQQSPNPVNDAVNAAENSNPIKTVTALVGKVGKFLDDLSSRALWIRIAEVAAGLILLAIGANALFKNSPLSAVTKTAGKLAPLALA